MLSAEANARSYAGTAAGDPEAGTTWRVEGTVLPDNHKWHAIHVRNPDKEARPRIPLKQSTQLILMRVGLRCFAFNKLHHALFRFTH